MTDKKIVTDSLQMSDHIMIDAKEVRVTADGYLVSNPRVARTGIQLYRGDECGRPDMAVVRVMRPEAEVFNKDSMRTFAFRPITDDHPKVPVTSRNWKDHSVGQSGGEVARDGEFMRVPMVVMDEGTIGKVKAGKAELSVGYTCDLKWESGQTEDGQAYDAIQTNIRANHIAVVKAARGGDKLRIGDVGDPQQPSGTPDNHQENKKMNDKTQTLMTVDVDGISVEMSDIAASVVRKRIATLQSEIDGLKDKLKGVDKEKETAKDSLTKATDDHKKVIETKDAEITTLKSQLEDAKKSMSPAALDQLVKDRAETIGKAKAILGDKLVVDGKDEADIRKQVVTAKLGDAAKDWGADAIKASFQTLTADVKADTAVNDGRAAFSAPAGGGQQMTDMDALYAKRDQDLSKRWMNGGTAAK